MALKEKGKGNVTVIDDSSLLEPLELRRGRETSILVVDDNPKTLNSIIEAIDDDRRRIIGVREAGSAIDLLYSRGKELDILLADFHLKRGNETRVQGDKLCEIAKDVNPDIKTVLITGDPSDADTRFVDRGVMKTVDGKLKKVDSTIVRGIIRKLEDELKRKSSA